MVFDGEHPATFFYDQLHKVAHNGVVDSRFFQISLSLLRFFRCSVGELFEFRFSLFVLFSKLFIILETFLVCPLVAFHLRIAFRQPDGILEAFLQLMLVSFRSTLNFCLVPYALAFVLPTFPASDCARLQSQRTEILMPTFDLVDSFPGVISTLCFVQQG